MASASLSRNLELPRYRAASGDLEGCALLDVVGDAVRPDAAAQALPEEAGMVVCSDGGRRMLDVIGCGFPHQIRGASGKLVDKPVTNVRNLASPFWRSLWRTRTPLPCARDRFQQIWFGTRSGVQAADALVQCAQLPDFQEQTPANEYVALKN